MSQLTGRPTTNTPRPSRAKRSLAQDDSDTDSILPGVILAAIIWPLFILLLWLATRHLGSVSSEAAFKPVRRPNLEVQLMPDEYLMPRKPQQKAPKFVETNPDAPENIPDNTTNFAAQNQQAAQEKPTPDAKGDSAATKGKEDFQSNQIVSGQLRPPTEAPPPEPPPTPEVAKALQQAAEARKAENPLPGFEKLEGINPEGFGQNIAPPSTEKSTSAPEKVAGAKDAPTTVGNVSPMQAAIDPRKPQPRLALNQQNTRPAIFENRVGTQNIGLAGFDAHWSQYGAYLHKMCEAVQIQFDRLNDESHIYPPTGTIVTIVFKLDKEGKVAEIVSSESTGGKQAESLCKTAITSRAPYGVWTDDMVAMLGESTEFTWKFYYLGP